MASAQTAVPNEARPSSSFATDDALRRLFLRTSLRMSQPLDQTTSVSPGGNITIRIPGVGLGRFVRLFVQATVTGVIGTGTLNMGSRGPFNLFSRIYLQDPGGTPRINCSGYELYLRRAVTTPSVADPTFTSTVYAPLNTEVYNAPAVVNGANVWNFWIDVPFEMGALDTRGLINLESATANASLILTVNPALYGTTPDSPVLVSGNATASVTAINLTPVYYFYSPVYLYDTNGTPSLALPTDDLQVIHEITTSRDVSIAANQEKRLNLPSGRTYQRIFAQLVNNTPAMVTGTVNAIGVAGATQVRFAYDVSKYTYQEPLQAYLARIRDDNGRDLPTGVFLWDLTNRPWDASRYGQVDAILQTDAAYSAGANAYVDVAREALYIAPSAG
jgi:hypothetical protein